MVKGREMMRKLKETSSLSEQVYKRLINERNSGKHHSTTQETLWGAKNYTVHTRQNSALQSGLGRGGMLSANFQNASGLHPITT